MKNVKKVVPLSEGDVISEVWYSEPTDLLQDSQIKVDWEAFTGSSTVTITVYGRMTDDDAWLSLTTFTEADFGTGTTTYTAIKNVSNLPQMYITVVEGTDPNNTKIIYYMAEELNTSAWKGSHVFDFADNVPTTFSIMSMANWHGIPDFDVIGGVTTAGPDLDYGGWQIPEAKAPTTGWSATNPTDYPNDPYGIHFPSLCGDIYHAGMRSIASKLSPLNGIYSNSGEDVESISRMDLTLGILRASGNANGRIDAMMPMVGSFDLTAYTLGDGHASIDNISEIRYRCLANMLNRCDALGYENCVIVQNHSPNRWIYDLDETENERRAGFINDIVDMVTIVKNRKAAMRLNGRLVIGVFISGDTEAYVNATEWAQMLDRARSITNEDFYAITSIKDTTMFKAFDAIYPWIGLATYALQTGTDLAKAEGWATDLHETYLDALASYPGRTVLGNISNGFTDWTKQHGDGVEREIPRNADTIQGQFDGIIALRTASKEVGGFVFAIWDDWGEGNVWEPDVANTTDFIELLTTELAAYYSETVTPAHTASFIATFNTFGLVRACP